MFLVISAMKETFSNFWYWLLAFVVFSGTIFFAIWLPNLSFLKHVVVGSSYDAYQKIAVLAGSWEAINTNFTSVSRIVTIIVALLFAVNIALIVFYFKKRAGVYNSAGVSLGGALVGFIGVGCASCGSVLLTAVLGLGTTASFIKILPLKGQEFGVLAIAILLFSIFTTARKIKSPLVC